MNPKPCLLLLGFLGMTAAQVNDAPATEEPPIPKQTFVYKTVGPTKIELDVYRRDGADPRPAVVWIHGGALIMGNRDGVPKDIFNVCRAQNYALFSLDYRLAPQTKLPEIIEDIQDAFRWIHTQGVSRLHVDPAKILVCGGSAGGYLTMMTGICVEPCPKALLSYWGYGDIDAAWYIEPSAFYRARPLVSREEALRSVGEGVSTGHDKNPRDKFYLYCRQNGLWTKEVAALDPKTDRQKLDRFCPVRNITPYYPPILMIHGTADTDVPYQESADMNAALTRQHVPHEFITVDGGDHGLSDRNNLAVINAHARAIAFIRKQLD